MAGSGFAWGSAAGGGQDALQKLLAERMLDAYRQATIQQGQQAIDQRAQEEINQNARAQEQIALQRRNFEADEKYRTGQVARQAQQDDIAAADRRRAENQRGVRSQVLEGLMTKTTDPRTAQLMAAGEGVDIPMDVLDPDREQRTWQTREGVEHRNRLAEIGAQRQPLPLTSRDRVQALRQADAAAADYLSSISQSGVLPANVDANAVRRQFRDEYLNALDDSADPRTADTRRAVEGLRDVFPRGPVGSREAIPAGRPAAGGLSSDPYEQYIARLRGR